jgi:phosphatidylserine decarboxylase
MKIHKEGYTTILITIFVLLVLNLSLSLAVNRCDILNYIILTLSIIAFAIIVRFFRSPKRNINIDDALVLSAADGTVVAIETVDENEYFKGERKLVSVFMSLHNVHNNRYPVSGIVKYMRHHQGKYLVAFNHKSSEKNERTTIVLETTFGKEILFRQIAGFLARRIVCYSEENTQVTQGEEMGFIKFGSRLDIFLPMDAKVLVKIDEKVKSGITPIAKIK